ncbi:MAG: hypothetical protein KC615_13260 [Anaerolineae bacterium]|nr:hypothetical protein [Anaerolineae bacterium]
MNSSSSDVVGCTFELTDDNVAIFRFADLKRESVDLFVDTLKQLVKERDAEQAHSRTLVDAYQLSMPTPYAAKRFQELVKDKPETLKSSVAIITSSRMVNTFVQAIFSRMPRNKHSHLHLFDTEEAALAWLDERLQEVGP